MESQGLAMVMQYIILYSIGLSNDNATVAIYGCDNFVIDNIEMINSAGMLIGYGVINMLVSIDDLIYCDRTPVLCKSQ